MSAQQIFTSLSSDNYEDLSGQLQEYLDPVITDYGELSDSNCHNYGMFCVRFMHKAGTLLTSGKDMCQELLSGVQLVYNTYLHVRDQTKLPEPLIVAKLLYHILIKLSAQESTDECLLLAESLYSEVFQNDSAVLPAATSIISGAYSALWNKAIKTEADKQIRHIHDALRLREVSLRFYLARKGIQDAVDGTEKQHSLIIKECVDKAAVSLQMFSANLVPLMNSTSSAFSESLHDTFLVQAFCDQLCTDIKLLYSECYKCVSEMACLSLRFHLFKCLLNLSAIDDALAIFDSDVSELNRLNAMIVPVICVFTGNIKLSRTSTKIWQSTNTSILIAHSEQVNCLVEDLCSESRSADESDLVALVYDAYSLLLMELKPITKAPNAQIVSDLTVDLLQCIGRSLQCLRLLVSLRLSCLGQQASGVDKVNPEMNKKRAQLQKTLFSSHQTWLELLFVVLHKMNATGSRDNIVWSLATQSGRRYSKAITEASADQWLASMDNDYYWFGHISSKLGRLAYGNKCYDVAVSLFTVSRDQLTCWCQCSDEAQRATRQVQLWKVYESLSECQRNIGKHDGAMVTLMQAAVFIDMCHVTSLAEQWVRVKKDSLRSCDEETKQSILRLTLKQSLKLCNAHIDMVKLVAFYEAELLLYNNSRGLTVAKHAVLCDLLEITSSDSLKHVQNLLGLAQVLFIMPELTDKPLCLERSLSESLNLLQSKHPQSAEQNTVHQSLILAQAELCTFLYQYEQVRGVLYKLRSTEADTEPALLTDNSSEVLESEALQESVAVIPLASRLPRLPVAVETELMYRLDHAVELWSAVIYHKSSNQWSSAGKDIIQGLQLCSVIYGLVGKTYKEIETLHLLQFVSQELSDSGARHSTMAALMRAYLMIMPTPALIDVCKPLIGQLEHVCKGGVADSTDMNDSAGTLMCQLALLCSYLHCGRISDMKHVINSVQRHPSVREERSRIASTTHGTLSRLVSEACMSHPASDIINMNNTRHTTTSPSVPTTPQPDDSSVRSTEHGDWALGSQSALDFALRAVSLHSSVLDSFIGKDWIKSSPEGLQQKEGMNLCDCWRATRELLTSFCHLASIYRRIGEAREAQCYMEEALRIAHAMALPGWVLHITTELANLSVISGLKEDADQLIDLATDMIISNLDMKSFLQLSSPGLHDRWMDIHFFINSPCALNSSFSDSNKETNNILSDLPDFVNHDHACHCVACCNISLQSSIQHLLLTQAMIACTNQDIEQSYIGVTRAEQLMMNLSQKRKQALGTLLDLIARNGDIQELLDKTSERTHDNVVGLLRVNQSRVKFAGGVALKKKSRVSKVESGISLSNALCKNVLFLSELALSSLKTEVFLLQSAATKAEQVVKTHLQLLDKHDVFICDKVRNSAIEGQCCGDMSKVLMVQLVKLHEKNRPKIYTPKMDRTVCRNIFKDLHDVSAEELPSLDTPPHPEHYVSPLMYEVSELRLHSEADKQSAQRHNRAMPDGKLKLSKMDSSRGPSRACINSDLKCLENEAVLKQNSNNVIKLKTMPELDSCDRKPVTAITALSSARNVRKSVPKLTEADARRMDNSSKDAGIATKKVEVEEIGILASSMSPVTADDDIPKDEVKLQRTEKLAARTRRKAGSKILISPIVAAGSTEESKTKSSADTNVNCSRVCQASRTRVKTLVKGSEIGLIADDQSIVNPATAGSALSKKMKAMAVYDILSDCDEDSSHAGKAGMKKKSGKSCTSTRKTHAQKNTVVPMESSGIEPNSAASELSLTGLSSPRSSLVHENKINKSDQTSKNIVDKSKLHNSKSLRKADLAINAGAKLITACDSCEALVDCVKTLSLFDVKSGDEQVPQPVQQRAKRMPKKAIKNEPSIKPSRSKKGKDQSTEPITKETLRRDMAFRTNAGDSETSLNASTCSLLSLDSSMSYDILQSSGINLDSMFENLPTLDASHDMSLPFSSSCSLIFPEFEYSDDSLMTNRAVSPVSEVNVSEVSISHLDSLTYYHEVDDLVDKIKSSTKHKQTIKYQLRDMTDCDIHPPELSKPVTTEHQQANTLSVISCEKLCGASDGDTVMTLRADHSDDNMEVLRGGRDYNSDNEETCRRPAIAKRGQKAKSTRDIKATKSATAFPVSVDSITSVNCQTEFVRANRGPLSNALTTMTKTNKGRRARMIDSKDMAMLKSEESPQESAAASVFSSEKLACDLEMYLDRALACVRHCPPARLYRELCQMKAQLCMVRGNAEAYEAAYWICESLAVTHRHKAQLFLSNTLRRLLMKKGAEQAAIDTCFKRRQLVQFSAYDSPRFQRFINSIPSTWVVCVLSVNDAVPGMDTTLTLTRLQCDTEPIVQELAGYQSAQGELVLSVFDAVMTESGESMQLTDKTQWWNLRRSLDQKLQGALESMESHWLGAWHSLLLGRPCDHAYEDRLTAATKDLMHGLCSDYGTAPPSHVLKVLLESSACESEVIQTLLHLITVSEAADTSISYDQELHRLRHIRRKHDLENASGVSRQPTLLVLDKGVQHLPWENLPVLRGHPVCRIPSFHQLLVHIHSLQHPIMGLDKNSKPIKTTASIRDRRPVNSALDTLHRPISIQNAFYILNPDSNLPSTEQTFKKWFVEQKTWHGIVGRKPSVDEFKTALTAHDLFIYCGHGGGSKYLNGERFKGVSCQAIALLMGCSSGRLRVKGELEASGMILNYLLADCPCIIANLWDVTDRDIDRFLLHLLKEWVSQDTPLPASNNSAQIREARDICKLPYLIGAAPVVYGFPVLLNR